MKRLKNLKMLILSIAITGILGFNSVSAMEKNPSQINTEQDIINKFLNNKKDLLAKLKDLKEWRITVEKSMQDTNENEKKDILEEIDCCIEDFKFCFDSLKDGEYDDDFYNEQVELYKNIKNNVESYLEDKDKNRIEKSLKNKKDLLAKLKDLKEWRITVEKRMQDTNENEKKTF